MLAARIISFYSFRNTEGCRALRDDILVAKFRLLGTLSVILHGIYYRSTLLTRCLIRIHGDCNIIFRLVVLYEFDRIFFRLYFFNFVCISSVVLELYSTKVKLFRFPVFRILYFDDSLCSLICRNEFDCIGFFRQGVRRILCHKFKCKFLAILHVPTDKSLRTLDLRRCALILQVRNNPRILIFDRIDNDRRTIFKYIVLLY